MIKKARRSKLFRKISQNALAVLCSFLLLQMGSPRAAQTQEKPDSPVPKGASTRRREQQEATVKIPPDELDSLVAPIALYPDPMLAQVLAASTYPLELIQLQQWLAKKKDLKDKALVDAVSKQPWDPSIQGLAALPEVVKRLAEDIELDHRSRQRVSGPAKRRDGSGSAHEEKGHRRRQLEIDRAAKGRNQGCGIQASHCHRTIQSGSCLRSEL